VQATRLLVTMIAIVITSVVWGQTPAPPEADNYGTARYGCYYAGARDGVKVSGTKVEFMIMLYLNPSANPGVTPSVSAIQATNVKITWGTTILCNDSADLNPWDYVPAFRYASTAFNDGAEIPIKVDIDFLLTTSAGPVTKHFTHIYKPVAYNKLQTLGNHVSAGGIITNAQFEADSNATTTVAHTNLSPAHTTSPGAIAQAETRTTVLAKIKAHTAFVASSHGDQSSVKNSASTENILFRSNNNTSNLTIQKKVSEKAAAGIPPYNLVALYACACLGIYAGEGFGINELSVSRALVGFANSVSIQCFSAATWNLWVAGDIFSVQAPDKWLNDHSEVVFDQLGFGKTVGAAQYQANQAFITVSTQPFNGAEKPTIVPLGLIGDAFCRISKVYLEPFYWQSLSNPYVDWIRLDPYLGGN
ncbi:MAG: hypothetical protein ABL962_14935, partial [Fimbriimonadaceae bacterium]